MGKYQRDSLRVLLLNESRDMLRIGFVERSESDRLTLWIEDALASRDQAILNHIKGRRPR